MTATVAYQGPFELEERSTHSDSVREVHFKDPSSLVRGPSVFVIGLIPYYDSIYDLIPATSGYHRFYAWRQYGFKLLFRTGNRPPPEALCTASLGRLHCGCGSETLAEFFEKNPPERPEFRTICWLRDMTITPRANNRAYLSFLRGYRIGATPAPSSPDSAWRWRRPPRWLPRWLRDADGKGEDTYSDLAWSSDGVTFTYKHTFKLGWLANTLSALLMGKLAPSALIRIKYTLKTDNSAQVTLGGSTIPSQTFYIDCKRQGRWDMVLLDEHGIRSFIEAGSCTTAPDRLKEYHYPTV